MAKYNIIQPDTPVQYKEQIVSFWNEYLPDTPPERFEWLQTGNPSGPTTWFLALLEKTNEVTGTVSLMPGDILHNGRTIHGAIMGDLMVAKNHRVFGPVLNLLKTAVKKAPSNDLDLIYTVPNFDSLKLVQRVGIKTNMRMRTYTKPLDVSYYLQRYLPGFISKAIGLFIKLGTRVFSLEPYIITKGSFHEVTEIDYTFDEVWAKIKCNPNITIGNHSSEYIKWRYLKNPLHNFRIFVLRDHNETNISGYIIFSENNQIMEIYDIVSLEDKYINFILKNTIHIARKEKYRAIHFTVPLRSKWSTVLRYYGFLNLKYDWDLYWMESTDISLHNWFFFQGDRNM